MTSRRRSVVAGVDYRRWTRRAMCQATSRHGPTRSQAVVCQGSSRALARPKNLRFDCEDVRPPARRGTQNISWVLVYLPNFDFGPQPIHQSAFLASEILQLLQLAELVRRREHRLVVPDRLVDERHRL